MSGPQVAREAGSAVLYLTVQAAWGLYCRLQPQDQPAAVRPYNPARMQAERSKP
jgi:hypothetical protein